MGSSAWSSLASPGRLRTTFRSLEAGDGLTVVAIPAVRGDIRRGIADRHGRQRVPAIDLPQPRRPACAAALLEPGAACAVARVRGEKRKPVAFERRAAAMLRLHEQYLLVTD